MRDERGSTNVDYVGVFVVVAALLAGLTLTPAARPVVDGIRTAICRIIEAGGGDPCGTPNAGGPARPSGEPSDPCVRSAHEESSSLGVKVGVVHVGSSMYTTREETSDGKVTLTYANGFKAGLTVGAGGKAKLKLGGQAVGASASVGVEGAYNGKIGDTYQFKDARQADAFEKKVDDKFVDLMTSPAFAMGGGPPSDPGTLGMYLKMAAEDVAKKMKPPPTRVTYEQGGGSVVLDIGGTLGPAEAKAGVSTAEYKGRRTDEASGQITEYFQLNDTLSGSAGVLFLGGVQGVKDTTQVVTLVRDRSGKPIRATIATTTKVTKGFQWPGSAESEKKQTPAVKAQSAAAKAALEKVAANIKDGETKAVTLTVEVPLDDPQSMNLVAGLLTGTDPATGQPVAFTPTAEQLQERAAGKGTTSIVTSTGGDGGLDLSVEGSIVLKLGVDVGYSTSDSRVQSAQFLPPGSTTAVDWTACVK